MRVAIWLMTTAAVPPVVCVCAATFLGYLAVRWWRRQWDFMIAAAGEEA